MVGGRRYPYRQIGPAGSGKKIGLGLTAFVLIKTQHHSSEWYCRFVTVVTEMPEVLGFWRMAGEYDYLMRVQVADMKRYDEFR